MKSLAVPWAHNAEGRIVRPSAADKGQAYTCPECTRPVTWRQCDEVNRQSHFAHLPDDPCAGGESAFHSIAKHLLAQTLNDARREAGLRPMLESTCGRCNGPRMPWPMPLEDHEALVENSIAPGTRSDVTMGPRLALEILHTHPVSDETIEAYRLAGVHWIEFKAALAVDSPSRWVVTRSSLKMPDCLACLRRELAALKTEFADVASRMSLSQQTSDQALETVAKAKQSLRAVMGEEQDIRRNIELISLDWCAASDRLESIKAEVVSAEHGLAVRVDRAKATIAAETKVAEQTLARLNASVETMRESALEASKNRDILRRAASELESKIASLEARRGQIEAEVLSPEWHGLMRIVMHGSVVNTGIAKAREPDGRVRYEASDGRTGWAHPSSVQLVLERKERAGGRR